MLPHGPRTVRRSEAVVQRHGGEGDARRHARDETQDESEGRDTYHQQEQFNHDSSYETCYYGDDGVGEKDPDGYSPQSEKGGDTHEFYWLLRGKLDDFVLEFTHAWPLGLKIVLKKEETVLTVAHGQLFL